jgi:hypothetical protein
MALPRRRVRDEELPELPPLDGDDEVSLIDVGPEGPLDDEPSSLDDAAADELTLIEIDEPTDLGDDAGVPLDTGDDADDVPDDTDAWGDDGDTARGEADDVEALDELPPDDGGVEGLDGERADDLDALPPIDDDADDDAPAEIAELPEAAAHGLLAYDGVEARVLVAMDLGAAPGVCVGVDHVFVAGDRLLAWPTALLDDPEAVHVTLDGPDEEALCAVSEDAARTLTVAAPSGTLWRRARARDPWRRLRWTDDDREGPVELAARGHGVWALSSRGALRREEGAHFVAALLDERVRSLATDAGGGAAAAVSGRRHDGVRATEDGVGWGVLTTPEALDADVVARAGEVFAVAGATGGYVTVDGGARWASWPLLAGATALCVGETDDGDPRLFAAVGDGERALVVTARVASDASAVGPTLLCDVTALLPRAGDEDASVRVERVVAVDRAGRQLLVTTSTGAVIVATRKA